MKSQICIDASLIIALVIPERFSRLALSFWQKWTLDDSQIVAPSLLRYEVTSALYRKAYQKQVSSADSLAALEQFLALDIITSDPPGLPLRATELARQFNRPNTYDAHYMALAEQLSCPFWTADERLYNAVYPVFPGIFWLGSEN
jgi:predicted nucleic acid-binding protein